jgi:hypothetical protein
MRSTRGDVDLPGEAVAGAVLLAYMGERECHGRRRRVDGEIFQTEGGREMHLCLGSMVLGKAGDRALAEGDYRAVLEQARVA